MTRAHEAMNGSKLKRTKTGGSGKWSKYRGDGQDAGPDWAEVDANLIRAAMSATINDGDAVLFGATRDGGTLVLTLISGEDRLKLYARTGAEMEEHLREVVSFKP